MEDEVPDVNAGTADANPDTASGADDPFAGFEEALIGHPAMSEPGEPAAPKAVETSETVETPEVETDKPADDKAAAPDKTEDKTPPAQTVNFDGFSDSHKATLERLLKAGHVTVEEIETARLDALRQNLFSKKTDALAKDRKTFDAEMAERREDLALLDRIRGDDRLHAAWLKMSKNEVPDDGEDDPLEEPVGAKKAAKIAEKTYESKDAAKQAERTRTDAAYKSRVDEHLTMLREQATVLGATKDQMRSYVDAEAAELADGADIALEYTPSQLQKLVVLRHREALAQAKAAAAEEKLTKRTSSEARTAKQSLPPPRRVATPTDDSPLARTEAELGLSPDWGSVQGFRGTA